MKRKYKNGTARTVLNRLLLKEKHSFYRKYRLNNHKIPPLPSFLQRYPKWIRQSAMVFCAAAVLGIGYGAYQAFFDSRDQLEVVPPPETTTTAWIEPETTTVTSQSITSFTAETTRTTVTTGEKKFC